MYHESIEEFFEATEGTYYLLTKFGEKRIQTLILQILSMTTFHIWSRNNWLT